MAEARLYVGMEVKESMSSSASASPRESSSLDVVPPITRTGLAKYQGILAASGVHEIIVSGTLPKGETTQNVTYWIIDRDTNAIVSQVILPDRSNQFNRVEMRLKVARPSSTLQIGTFDSNGAFKPVEFLSVRSELNPSSNGSSGRIT
jgi:hypothetical protein